MKYKAPRRVTLQDIANETGYSVNTVSHALRDLPDISAPTVAKIREAARNMGYTVNQLASSLRSGRTHLIAVILGGMTNPFYAIMADRIQDAAQLAGYSVMIMCSRDNSELESKLIDQALARCVDGILLFPTAGSQPAIDRMREANIPFVLMSRYLEKDQADCVLCDEKNGAALATKHLISKGRRRLAYVSASSEVPFSSAQRIGGFIAACEEAGIPEEDRRLCIVDSAGHENDENIPEETLIALKEDGFDGLFIFCDVQAWHAIDTIQHSDSLSLSDFGMVSFDNIEGALSFPVSLCSVGMDFSVFANEGLQLLRHRIHHPERPPQTVVCPVTLSCRSSCLP